MTNDITKQRPKTGRTLREDSSVINTADLQALNTSVLTTTPLAIDAVYTGATNDSLTIFPVPAMAFAYSQSDVASAATGFLIEQSDNADMSSPSTIVSATAGAGALSALAPTAITKRYFRVRYTNAHANPQTTFKLLLGYTSATENVTTVTGSVTATLSSQAFTNTILTAVEDTIAHTIGVQVKGVRAAAAGCTAHRTSLTAPDLLGAVATAPGVLTGSGGTFADSTVAEGNLPASPLYGAYIIRNGFGVTMASVVTAGITPTVNHSMKVTIPTAWRITDADAVYEFFLSTDTAPKHVCTFTAAQLAASATTRCTCTTAETPVVSGAGTAAWECYIGVQGANAQTTAAQFAQSTAYTIGAISPVVTTGYNSVDLFVDAQQTAYTTTAPQLTLIPVYLNDKQGANYHVGGPIPVSLLSGSGQSFRQMWNLTTNGASVIILVASIANVTVNRIDVTPTSVV